MTLLATPPKMTVTSHSHGTQGCGAIKKTSNTAAEDLMKQVTLEKKVCKEKKKERQAEKKAEMELAKAEREATLSQLVVIATVISPPLDMEEEYVPLPKDSPLFEMLVDELIAYAKDTLGLSEEGAESSNTNLILGTLHCQRLQK
jgi:hypothetical protein